jgi:very-short-patch-repair endonuclease
MERLDPIEFARHLRQTADGYEQLLWELVRNRQRCNKKFRRQHPLGAYTADFYCAEAKLVVEIDGESHFSDKQRAYDAARDKWMASQGIRVLRFCGKQVEFETAAVCAAIDQALQEQTQSKPSSG